MAESENIFFDFDNLMKHKRVLGLYYFDPHLNLPCITLDKSLECNTPLCRSVFAEELGHHFTIPLGSLLVPYTSYNNQLMLNKDESKALKWACDHLMPEDDFLHMVAGGMSTLYDLAEYYVVTEWLVRWRKMFLNQKIIASHYVV